MAAVIPERSSSVRPSMECNTNSFAAPLKNRLRHFNTTSEAGSDTGNARKSIESMKL
jgi:hypothetical protein